MYQHEDGVSARRRVGAQLAETANSGQNHDSLSRRALGESQKMTRDSPSRLAWAPLLSIASAAFAVEIPFFFRGMPSGHDLEFHLYSWLEVLSQWKQGIVYPRWAALAQFGYGEPRFLFYPPASWTLGAALSAIFPWTLVASIYIWIVLAAAGVSMFLLARQWLDRRDATFAAVLYAVNPYHLVIVYWRSAFAELLASSLLPLLLLLLLRADEKGGRVTVLLALLLASAWLINDPAAVMIHYSLALLIVVIAWQRRSPRVLLVGTIAVILGAALAAFYLLPAVYEQKWVSIAEAVSSGLRPQDSFLFSHTPDPLHDAFNRVVSWVASAEILLTVVAAWAARSWRLRNRTLWYSLVTWAAACAVLMLSITDPLWNLLPKLQFMQFPWRWMLCLGVPFILLIVLGVRRWTVRAAICLAMLGVLAFGWQHFQAPWWDHAADLRELRDNMATGAGYEGVDEYTPLGADPSSVDKDARRVTVGGPARAAIHVLQWNPEFKLFTAEMSAPDNLALRLFNYPAWRIEVNGLPVEAGAREDTGQMLVPVVAGTNRVRITFIRTWDRKAGAWISIIAIVLVLVSLKTVAPASRRPLGRDALAARPNPAEGTAAETAALPES
jgi:6-pyruvoyl-tetrahydropterin synthase-like protein